MASFSHTSLKDFEGCNRRYHEVRVLKKYPFEETAATKYGNELHKAVEEYILASKPLAEQFAFVKPTVDVLLAKPGRKLAEQKMALDKDLRPCDWKSRNAWVRGIADLLILNDDNLTARVVDWKTGGNKYPDPDQLRLMSLLVFAHYPHIRRINSALIFVVKGTIETMSMSLDEAEARWWQYRERVAKIDSAIENGVFNPTQSGLCGWCPCKNCEHHFVRRS
jgi:hypothetical protein